jgi:hypothetical protein
VTIPFRSLGLLAAACVAAAAGCAEDDPAPRSTADEPAARTADEGSAPAPPPDAGTATGHGPDPVSVTVPRRDPSPPSATVTLARPGGEILARAAIPGDADGPSVRLDGPRLVGTTTGEDPDGGVARVRVSIKERVSCPGGVRRLRTRYFPPPQIERIRSRPGAQLPTRRSRSLELSVGRGRCDGGGAALAVAGELWGEAINGSGLEGVTPHIRFAYRRLGQSGAE